MKILSQLFLFLFLGIGYIAAGDWCLSDQYRNLARSLPVGASSAAPRHMPFFAVDGDDATFWESLPENDNPWILVYLEDEFLIDRIILPLFAGFDSIRIEVFTQSAWRQVFNGSAKKQVLFGFNPVRTDKVRLIFNTSDVVTINEVQVYTHNPQPIFTNQSGYNLYGPKRFTAPKAVDGTVFNLKREGNEKTLYQGQVLNHIGDFSGFTPKDDGPYIIQIQEDTVSGTSFPFNIGPYWIQKVSYQKALDFMIDARCFWGDARGYSPTDTNSCCTRGVAWRDGVQYSFEVPSLIMMYLANPSAFSVERMSIQGPYLGLRHDLPEQTPEIVRLIYWGVDIFLRAKVDHALLKEQLAYFVYAYPYFEEFIPRDVYEEALTYLIKIWGKAEFDRYDDVDFNLPEIDFVAHSANLFETYEVIGTGKGQFPPGHSIVPNLMMYEVAKREGIPEADRFFRAAYDQTQWILRNLDWENPRVTKGQRQGEWLTITSLVYFMKQYPERAPKDLVDKIRKWAEVMISRSDNLWDYRKYSDERWTIPNILPADHPTHAFNAGFNEPGNIAGLPAPLLAASMIIDDRLINHRLQQLAAAHIDHVFGRNPAGRHFSYDAVEDFEGVELGWFKEYQGGAGELQFVRGVLDGSPKETTYPFNPYAGDPGHTEGWVTFNTPWNISLAFLSSHETNLEVFDRSFIKPIQTISLANEDRQIGILLQAPLNFDYSKVESGEVMIQTSRGDSYRMTVYEKTTNDMAFTGLINFDEGRVDPGDDLLQVRPGDMITVSYAYDFFKKSVTIEVIK